MIDYGRDDAGKASIGGFKSEEQSWVEVLNAQMKFEYKSMSEAVRFDV